MPIVGGGGIFNVIMALLFVCTVIASAENKLACYSSKLEVDCKDGFTNGMNTRFMRFSPVLRRSCSDATFSPRKEITLFYLVRESKLIGAVSALCDNGDLSI